jgi:hypothetical protein
MSCSPVLLHHLVKQLQKRLPADLRRPVDVAALRHKWHDLPEDYVFIIENLGSGDYLAESWYFYPEPYSPQLVPQARHYANVLKGFYLIAEDQEGWYLGYDSRHTPWRFCEFDATFQPIFSDSVSSLCAFLRQEFDL